MVNQGSHGLVGHGVEGHRTVSCGRQGSRRKVRGERLVEGVMVWKRKAVMSWIGPDGLVESGQRRAVVEWPEGRVWSSCGNARQSSRGYARSGMSRRRVATHGSRGPVFSGTSWQGG